MYRAVIYDAYEKAKMPKEPWSEAEKIIEKTKFDLYNAYQGLDNLVKQASAIPSEPVQWKAMQQRRLSKAKAEAALNVLNAGLRAQQKIWRISTSSQINHENTR